MVSVVVGALGSVSKMKLAGHLEQQEIKDKNDAKLRTRTMQKSALLGSAHILTKMLEV